MIPGQCLMRLPRKRQSTKKSGIYFQFRCKQEESFHQKDLVLFYLVLFSII